MVIFIWQTMLSVRTRNGFDRISKREPLCFNLSRVWLDVWDVDTAGLVSWTNTAVRLKSRETSETTSHVQNNMHNCQRFFCVQLEQLNHTLTLKSAFSTQAYGEAGLLWADKLLLISLAEYVCLESLPCLHHFITWISNSERGFSPQILLALHLLTAHY